MMDQENAVASLRQAELLRWGANTEALNSLLEYEQQPYLPENLPDSLELPLAEEPHVEIWREYGDVEPGQSLLERLQTFLPQLAIPIAAGVSKSEAYANVVRRGQPFQAADFDGTLSLHDPAALRLEIQNHVVGALPVLSTTRREDFLTIVRALVGRSEPIPIGAAVNAQFVTGMINWDRMRRYQREYLAKPGLNPAVWPAEMKRVASFEKWRFQDRFLILCAATYSGTTADQMKIELTDQQWLDASSILRQEHEFVHYFTTRLFGLSRLHLLDELACDWYGLVQSLGEFRGDWLQIFLGLRSDGTLLDGARLTTYTGELQGNALETLCRMTVAAIQGLEQLHQQHFSPTDTTRFLLTILGMTLEELASESRAEQFLQMRARVGQRIH
ncbi:MAG: hypothetical protein AB8B91_21565 [Rubripirellula sp.]